MGSPVEPEVKMIVAVSSSPSPRSPGKKVPRAAIGTTLASTAARTLSAVVTALARSSSISRSAPGFTADRARILGDVMTRLIPACSRDESRACWLAV